MTSDTPGPGSPGPDDNQPGGPVDDAPTEAVPGLPPAWGSAPPPAGPPSSPPPLDAPAPALDAPAAPPAWGAAAAATPPPAGPPGQPPAGAPGQPPTQPAQWGAPPPQQPMGWGPGAAPVGAPQQPGWGAAPGAPGGPPETWNPQPAKSGTSGCLKACLIVGVILVVLAIVAGVGISLLANQFVTDLGVDPNSGELRQCELVTGAEIDQVFGGEGAEVVPMGGIIDATIGAVLDKRVLRDASDCWILTGGTSSSVTGRIARAESINASADFQAAKAAATEGTYFGGDVSGLGDEAFCTGASEQSPSFGVLVRQGGSLVYVSLIDPTFASQGDWETTEDGVLVSPRTCELAGEVAAAVLR